MKAFGMIAAFLFAAAVCIAGCAGGAGSPGAVALMPGPPGSSAPPGSTPGPTSPPTSTPTSPPSGVASYQGCNVFTAGDWY
ncbi:MAG: hypothetical protein ABI231_04345, partial [Candidatus Tumulicola sp.]